MSLDLPFLKFYVDKWNDAVDALELDEEGAYMRLICAQWRKGFIPVDTNRIGLLLKRPRAFARIWRAIEPFFPIVDGDGVRVRQNAFLETVRADVEDFNDAQREKILKRWKALDRDRTGEGSGVATGVVPSGDSETLRLGEKKEKKKIAPGKAGASSLPGFEHGKGLPGSGESSVRSGPKAPAPKQRRQRRAVSRTDGDDSTKLPTIAEACTAIGHAVLVEPFPREAKYPARMNTLLKAYPTLDDWRAVADWLARGGDGWNGGAKSEKPSLWLFLSCFGEWRQKALATATPPPQQAAPVDDLDYFDPCELAAVHAYMAEFGIGPAAEAAA